MVVRRNIKPGFRLIFWREVGWLRRRPFLLGLTTVVPLVLVALLSGIFSAGLATRLPIGVLDLDGSDLSRTIIRMVDATPDTAVAARVGDLAEGRSLILSGKIHGLLMLPLNLQRDVFAGRRPEVVFFYNTQTLTTGNLAVRGVNAAVPTAAAGIRLSLRTAQGQPLDFAAADLQPSVSVTAPGAKASCLPMPDDRDAGESCVIAEFGEVGAVDNHRFHFAVYQYQNPSSSVLNHTRVVVFEAPVPGTMRAVVATESDPAIGYDKPRILRSGDRVLLHIPGREAGTGNFNRERLYMWRAGQWREVDTTSWLERSDAPPTRRLWRLEGDLSRLPDPESLHTAVAEGRWQRLSDRRPGRSRPGLARRPDRASRPPSSQDGGMQLSGRSGARPRMTRS